MSTVSGEVHCDFLASTEIKTFTIPQYQRNYSWDKLQLDDFWNDLDILLGNNSKHFLGLIVSIKDGNNLEIVDGQQRLTSTSLLYIAVIDVLSDLFTNKDVDQIITKKIDRKIQEIKKFLFSDPDCHDSIKLRPNDNDRIFYDDLIKDMEYIRDLESKKEQKDQLKSLGTGSSFEIKIDYLKSLTKSNGQKKWNFQSAQHFKMYKAYKYFYDVMQDHINDVTHTNDKITKITTLISSITQFHIMSFSTTEDAEAFNLFETLNDRGLSLAAIDLIKNQFVKRCAPDTRKERSNDWDDIFGVEGTLVDENPNLFLRQYYNSKKTPVTHSQIYKVYNSEISALDVANDPESIGKWLQQMSVAAIDYVSFKKLSPTIGHPIFERNRVLEEILHLLYKTKSVQWHTIAFSIFQRFRLANDQELIKVEINKLFWAIFKLILKFMILDKRFNTIEKKFPAIAKSIYEKRFDDDSETLEDIDLLKKAVTEIENLIPSDNLSFTNEIRDNGLAYILCRLCIIKDYNSDITNLDFDKITLEHIRPQQGSNWVECDDEGKVYQLGNMILLKQTSNSKVSNKSLVEKKKVYKQVGVCDVAKPDVYSINSEEEWDIAISDRSLDISTKLISILDADEFPY